MCFRLLADLNSPLFVPDPISLDRKHILEDMEDKYRDFITAALRCLTELKRELCECRLWRPAHNICLRSSTLPSPLGRRHICSP